MIAQSQHLQRVVDSLGGGNNNNNNNECPQQIITSPSTGTVGAFKKRKLDQVVTVQTISDSSDEGLGSMSPEPVSQMILTNGSSGTIATKTHTTSVTTINVKDYVNLQNQMETERRHRIQLEEQLRHLEMQVYSNQQAAPAVAIAGQKYQIHEETEDVEIHQPVVGTVIEEKIIIRQSTEEQQQQQQHQQNNNSNSNIHYHVPHHQYVVVSTSTPGSSPKNIIMNDNDEDSRTLSSDELHKDEVKLVRKMSPKHQQTREIRIPSILEKAIKAEPKVEVERISSPVIHINMIEEAAVQSPPRLTGSPTTIRTTYPSNNQRPNLETIVEAIRHLEGDAAFDMDDGQEQQQQQQQQLQIKTLTPTTQEAPLALTTNNKYHQISSNNRSSSGNNEHHNTQPFLKFRQTSTSQSGLPTFSVSVPSSQQQRPGVIVVKQSS